ncbi:fungal-specific transcription factor domain-containing protein [Aspergillus karnatakaensis]|uniref:fungal specific transcription factor domain-containing protein n=1 Tax=Aspergillus karnatakaensis TaxID=1810916 RepID=UPI003CCD4637
MKAGALDNIHRRLDALERSVGKQQVKLESLDGEGPYRQEDCSAIHTVLSTLTTSLQNLSKKTHLAQSSSNDTGSAKRRRIDDGDSDFHHLQPPGLPPLPDDAVLSHVLESYFIYVHPWTPIIHESRFRRRLIDDDQRDKLQLVLHSMILVARRYIEDRDAATSLEKSLNDSDQTRDWLVSQAMKQPSVENLQALVLIATDDIATGRASQAWPLVGSLSRMVEYLQLTVEHDEAVQHPFSQPYKSLRPPADWTEAEERRRIFWSIFALDRFCSVSMGWNTSLTADDVRRRLPCDGITWRKEDPVVTPYFGIWDKSAGRIGNPIAFLPTHSAPSRPVEDETEAPSEAGTSPGAAPSAVDMATVGAYAYCIEATESLSRVTTYFLQQKVNLNDQKDFGAWLVRFKELDLRLVHWKMLLPQKWTVNVAQQGLTRMDPNLTLAHVTHNASMILLHQPIAFPLPEWPFKSRLPSLCSMDTCQSAAVEVASITSHYLKSSLATSPLSSQFAFCLFIAARALMLYWQHTRTQGGVAPDFWVLIQSLDALSTRSSGIITSTSAHQNLAAKYSSVLTELHRRCTQDPSFSINIAGYTTEITHSGDEVQSPRQALPVPDRSTGSQDHNLTNMPESNRDFQSPHEQPSFSSPTQLSNRKNSAPAQQTFASQRLPAVAPNAYSLGIGLAPGANEVPGLLQSELSGNSDDTMAMSQMLLDQQFTGLDRVISYSDGLFGSEYDGGRW